MSFAVLLLLTFVRVACVMLTAPILGSRQAPWQLRILLALFVAIAVYPLVQVTALDLPSFDESWVMLLRGGQQSLFEMPSVPELISLGLAEVVIGTSLGLGVTIILAAARIAGEVVGQLAGLQWPTQQDAQTGETVSALSQLFGMVSLATFVLIGGPELTIGAFIESYRWLPVGVSLDWQKVPDLLTTWLQQCFLLTIRGVAPAVAALMISNLTISMISRAYPQANLLGISIHFNQLILMLIVLATMGGCIWLFVDDLPGQLPLILWDLEALKI